MEVQLRDIMVIMFVALFWRGSLMNTHGVSKGRQEEVVVSYCELGDDLGKLGFLEGGELEERRDMPFVGENW